MLEFEWDADKAAFNLVKHGVAFEEAISVFADQLAGTLPDPDSEGEYRFVTTGLSARGRLLVVVSSEARHTIRIISAREANRREKKAYEEGH